MIVKLEKLMGHEKNAVVGKWLVEKDSLVQVGDELMSLESGKGTISVQSKVTGRVVNLLVDEGERIQIGDAVCDIDGEEVSEEQKEPSYSFGFAKQREEVVTCDVVIIGGGPGGYVAAIRAAQLGLHVVLVERERLGGTCLNRGCIPTKALVKSSQVYDMMNHSEAYGVYVEHIRPDMNKMVDRKNEIVDTLVGGIEYLMNHHKIQVIYGDGQVIQDEVVVETPQLKSILRSKHVVLATGSEPIVLDIPGVDFKRVLTSKELLELTEIPESLTIIGGGIIGMEFAFIFSALGTKVSVVEFGKDILTLLDRDVRHVVKSKCRQMNIALHTSSRAEAIIEDKQGHLITKFTEKDMTSYVVSDYVLMAVGRKPTFDQGIFKELDLEIDEQTKGVKVNDQMKTSNDKYYAIGDLTNKIQLAHVASHQGIVAIEAIAGLNTMMTYDVIPSGIFVTPEIGIVGMSEQDFKESGQSYSVGKFPFSSNGKALANGTEEGFVKIIIDEYDVVKGAAIVGYGATDLIAVITPLIENQVKADALDHTIFAHPTTAESIHEAFLDLKGVSLHHVSNNCISNTSSAS